MLKKIKYNFTSILFALFIIFTGLSFSQSYKIEKVNGTVKILDSNDKWQNAKEENVISANSLLVTEDNSSVKISYNGTIFTLKEASAIQVSNIKQMTLDELILALAMEDIINAPKRKGKKTGKTTAVYGTKNNSSEKFFISDDFGIKRMKGAVQLAENGFKESAVVSSKEIFRKYPGTGNKAEYRIYFADILFDLGLYEEAYQEYSLIDGLELSDNEKVKTAQMLSLLNKKLLN
jgi:hypothetical protein